MTLINETQCVSVSVQFSVNIFEEQNNGHILFYNVYYFFFRIFVRFSIFRIRPSSLLPRSCIPLIDCKNIC